MSRPPRLCPSEGHKLGTSANSARMKKNSRDLILGEVVYIAIIYHLPYSWIYIEWLQFLFLSHDWWKPRILFTSLRSTLGWGLKYEEIEGCQFIDNLNRLVVRQRLCFLYLFLKVVISRTKNLICCLKSTQKHHWSVLGSLPLSSEIVVNFRDMFENVRLVFGVILENLREVVGNPRKFVKNVYIHAMNRILHSRLGIWIISSRRQLDISQVSAGVEH